MLQTSASTLIPYVLVFCRVTIGLVFLISFLTKARNLLAFQSTIISFNILPRQMSASVALFFLAAEFITALLMLVGGSFLPFSFALAIFLLLAFSLALTSVLVRNVQTSCNCFGPTEKAVSRYDLVRNTGFILCALIGLWTTTWSGSLLGDLNLVGLVLAGLCAAIYIGVCMNLREVVQLFR